MTSRIAALTIDALDPAALEHFWTTLLPGDPGFTLRFGSTDQPKRGANQAHFDLTSTSLEDQQATVDHVVMADPEGNELCVIESWNNFLADTGRIGALSSDGTQAVGYFWSRALDWPLVWDQDEETAIQSPRGGSKISWGGPPDAPKSGLNRLRLELVVDEPAEVERLLSLGATRLGSGLFADPGGNEFGLS